MMTASPDNSSENFPIRVWRGMGWLLVGVQTQGQTSLHTKKIALNVFEYYFLKTKVLEEKCSFLRATNYLLIDPC